MARQPVQTFNSQLFANQNSPHNTIVLRNCRQPSTMIKPELSRNLPLWVSAVFLLVYLAASETDSKPCDDKKEFTCQGNNQCIPIEAKCDFTEQCIDGQDELGCASEHCDFSQDFCNWRNDLNFKFPQEGAANSGPSASKSRALWRRYLVGGKKTKLHSNAHEAAITASTPIGGRLRELSANHRRGSKFLYAPLLLNLSRLGKTSTPELPSARQLVPSISQVASISAPVVGQTSIMCQLRFRYSLVVGSHWRSASVSSVASSPLSSPATTLPLPPLLRTTSERRPNSMSRQADNCGATCGRAENFAIRLSLNLWAHERSSIKGAGGTKLLWTGSVDSVPQSISSADLMQLGHKTPLGGRDGNSLNETSAIRSPTELRSHTPTQTGAATQVGDWSVAVVELGHIRQVQLSFEAVARAEILDRNSTKAASRLSVGPGLVSGLVALDWLEFHHCNWPRESYRSYASPTEAVAGATDDSSAGSKDRFCFYDWATPISQLIGADVEAQAERRRSSIAQVDTAAGLCGPGEFQCSNDVCVSEQRLCNFVDDCMTSKGSHAANNNSVEFEDEAASLCGHLPGMEDFEQLNLEQLDPSAAAPGSGAFWTLTSDWPEGKISVLRNSKTARYLPQHDHTTGNTSGSFLSLEIPTDTKTLSDKETHWTYLKSPWMKKLGDEAGECRVKFFFNLVTDNPLGADPTKRLPFKIYMLVDHFVASDLDADSTITNPGLQFTEQRKVDSIILSHAIDYDKLLLDGELGVIEYPGVDFWREANINLVGLDEDDVFQIRVAVIVEIERNRALNSSKSSVRNQQAKATLNIDDMSTHFGCALAHGSGYNELAQLSMGNHPISKLSLNDIIKLDTAGIRPLIRKSPKRSRLNLRAIEVEPQMLVVYVFGVLATIIGIILAIVFVVVPYVERVTMGYQDRISLELNGAYDISDQSTGYRSLGVPSNSDWEQVLRRAAPSFRSERPETDHVTPLNTSRSCPTRLEYNACLDALHRTEGTSTGSRHSPNSSKSGNEND